LSPAFGRQLKATDIIRRMAFAELSDDQLVAESKLRKGKAREDVVEELFSRHYERVARWCYRMTSDRDAAADLAQEVFLKAHRHLDSFRGTSRFSTWLYSIARNESLNRIRRSEPLMDAEDVLSEVAAIEAGPEELAHRGHQASRLQEFLAANLDRTERIVFTLHYGDELSLDSITRILRLDNTSGAKAYIVSARRKLARAVLRLRATGEEL
jgi:RNA polymerase sigma-70 factor (ECF subfamily)